MAEQQIWGDKSRTVNDPTLIDEAIEQAVSSHNDDPDAHLGEEQALQSHRAAEIIDHLAESVVNDKIHSAARAYIAIVGSGQDGDFDTIQAAVAYAAGVGGGTILLMAGSYYLSQNINLPTNINLYAADPEATTVYCNGASNRQFIIVDDLVTGQLTSYIENITFVALSDGVFTQNSTAVSGFARNYFKNCKFTGGYNYFSTKYNRVIINDCSIEIGSSAAIKSNYYYDINNLFMTVKTGRTSCWLVAANANGAQLSGITIRNSKLQATEANNFYFTSIPQPDEITLLDTTINVLNTANWTNSFMSIRDCKINVKSTQKFNLPAGSGHSNFVGNFISGGTSPNLVIYASYSIITNNIVKGTPTNSGTGNIVANNITS